MPAKNTKLEVALTRREENQIKRLENMDAGLAQQHLEDVRRWLQSPTVSVAAVPVVTLEDMWKETEALSHQILLRLDDAQAI